MNKKSFSATPLLNFFTRSVAASLLSSLYLKIIRIRNRRYDEGRAKILKIKYPVISIGGIRAGGTGKTPLTLMIAHYVQSQHHHLAILSRGYKRKSKQYKIIKPMETVSWESIGDEPAMMRNHLPESWMGIGAKRVIGAQNLEKIVPPDTVFLLDDGFQHRSLFRTLDILCLDESILQDRIIPSGFLREPRTSITRAQVAVISGSEQRLPVLQKLKEELSNQFPSTSFFVVLQKKECWVEAGSGRTSSELPFKNPLAICGIARPDRFFNLLKSEGIIPSKELKFSDHHIYTEYDIKRVQKLYSDGLVTTEKDAVRLLNQKVALNLNIWYLKMKLEFENEGSFNRFNGIIDNIISHV